MTLNIISVKCDLSETYCSATSETRAIWTHFQRDFLFSIFPKGLCDCMLAPFEESETGETFTHPCHSVEWLKLPCYLTTSETTLTTTKVLKVGEMERCRFGCHFTGQRREVNIHLKMSPIVLLSEVVEWHKFYLTENYNLPQSFHSSVAARV